MSLDVIVNEREWRKEHRPGLWLLVSAAVIYAASLFLYRYEMQFTLTDLAVHAGIAADFDFTDLHSITSRLAYPLWHLMTSCVYQLGLPIEWPRLSLQPVQDPDLSADPAGAGGSVSGQSEGKRPRRWPRFWSTW